MIQLKTNKDGSFELTDKQSVVKLADKSVFLGEITIDTPGEYEASGVEIVYGQHAALVVWERLQLVYSFDLDTPSAFEEGQFTGCDVLILASTLQEVNKNALNAQLSAFDPKMVIVTNSNTFEAGLKESFKLQETTGLKLTIAQLPTEGRDFYLLT